MATMANSKQQRVELIKPWQLFQAGATINLDRPVAESLIASGRARASAGKKRK